MESSILSEVDDTSILRTGLPSPLWPSSQLATGLSSLAPAQRAGAQRLCALAPSATAGAHTAFPELRADPPTINLATTAALDLTRTSATPCRKPHTAPLRRRGLS